MRLYLWIDEWNRTISQWSELINEGNAYLMVPRRVTFSKTNTNNAEIELVLGKVFTKTKFFLSF